MKTINLTDEQFDTLFNRIDKMVKTIHRSLDDYITDYEEMDSTKIVPIIFKIEDILTNRGVFINKEAN